MGCIKSRTTEDLIVCLNAVGEEESCARGESFCTCCVFQRSSHTSRHRLNYTLRNKDPAQHTWTFDGCGENTESMGVAALYTGSNYGIIVCNTFLCVSFFWEWSSWVTCRSNHPSQTCSSPRSGNTVSLNIQVAAWSWSQSLVGQVLDRISQQPSMDALVFRESLHFSGWMVPG